jgi:hypothetical protein
MDGVEWFTMALAIIGLIMSAGSFLETFRREPWWPRATAPRPGPSPRQRRWLATGLVVLMTTVLIDPLVDPAGPWQWLVLASSGVALAILVAATVVSPAERERRRRARLVVERDGGRGPSATYDST